MCIRDRLYAVNFALQMNGRVFNSHTTKKDTLVVTDLTGKYGRHEMVVTTFDFDAVCKELGLEKQHIDYRPPSEGYKDWNDQLLDKRMDESMEQENTEEKQTRFRR